MSFKTKDPFCCRTFYVIGSFAAATAFVRAVRLCDRRLRGESRDTAIMENDDGKRGNKQGVYNEGLNVGFDPRDNSVEISWY